MFFRKLKILRATDMPNLAHKDMMAGMLTDIRPDLQIIYDSESEEPSSLETSPLSPGVDMILQWKDSEDISDTDDHEHLQPGHHSQDRHYNI